MEQMPMWCPPTPPTSDNDVYIDYSLGFLYENTPMSEAQLPPVFVKKEQKRLRVDPVISERDGRRPTKVRHKEESVFAPRSLFDRPSPALVKMRRDMKLHKFRGMVRPPVAGMSGLKPPLLKSPIEQENILEWTIHEDWALLQAIQVYQSLPLNLVVLSPGQTPNWDLVADIVNNTSRIYRSPKQCRNRYESVIVPREEGKLLYDTTPKKQKKQKGVYKMPQVAEQQSKTNRPMRTSQLYNQDKNYSFTSISCQRHDAIKAVSNKKAPTTKPLCMNPSMKNPKHAAVLADCGIQYDTPSSPMEIAVRKADRIAKEKMKNAVLTAEQQQQAAARLVQQQQQQLQQQQQQIQLQQAQPSAASASPQVPQATTTTTATALAPLKSVTTIASSSGTTAATTPIKTRPGTTLIQESRPTPTVVSVANISTPQRIATVNLVSTGQNSTVTTPRSIVGVTATGSKQVTQAQLQYFRQQQLLRQQHNIKVLQAQTVGAQKVAVSVPATAAAQQRAATLMKQGVPTSGTVQTAGGKQPVTRPVTDTEMAALLKRQAASAALQQTKTVGQVQVPGQTGLTPAQIFAQAGLQVQASTSTGGTPVATLVKTAGMGVRAATSQQIRQLQLHPQMLAQRKLPGQKVAQLAQVTGKGGVQTQLIVQKQSMPTTMTVQHLQQVMKQVQPSSVQQFTHVSSTGQTVVSQPGQVVLAKSPLQTRVIPVASGSLKQTIQVVAASSAQLRQSSPIQGKPIVATARGSPGPSQVRLQTITHPTHSQQVQQQQQQNPPDSQ